MLTYIIMCVRLYRKGKMNFNKRWRGSASRRKKKLQGFGPCRKGPKINKQRRYVHVSSCFLKFELLYDSSWISRCYNIYVYRTHWGLSETKRKWSETGGKQKERMPLKSTWLSICNTVHLHNQESLCVVYHITHVKFSCN